MQQFSSRGKLVALRRLLAVDTEPRLSAVKADEVVCQTCKRPIKDGVINYVHGGYDMQKMKTVITPCPACSATTANREHAKAEAERIIQIFGEARIPWRARDWSFSNYPSDADQAAKAQVQAFVRRHLTGDQHSKRMLYLAGATGRCKTSLALSALKEVLQAGRSGLYVMTAELLLKIQASFRSNSDYSQDELFQTINRVEWLVLDDLAVESGQEQKISAFTLKSLYLIIQKRADLGLYTIITSNLNPTDLEVYWRPAGIQAGRFHEGQRIVDRLREYCDGCAVQGRNQRA